MNPDVQRVPPPFLPAGAPSPARTNWGWAWAAGLLAASATALVLYFFEPTRWSFYPVCVFHQSTGLLCPGCGTLRSMHHFLHGHWWTAFQSNPLAVGALPVVALGIVGRAIRRWRRLPPVPPLRAVWIWSGLVVIVLFGVLRNLPLPQLAWMSP